MKINKKEKELLIKLQNIRKKGMYSMYYAGCFAGAGLILALLGLGLNDMFYTPASISLGGYLTMLFLISRDGKKAKKIKDELGGII